MAKARVVLADVLLSLGDCSAALATYHQAGMDLHRVGASRHAAAVWRQLAVALRRLGRVDDAADAYERLADATRVPSPIAAASPT